MGLVTAQLTLSNPRDPAIEPIEVPALADTGSVLASGIVKRAA